MAWKQVEVREARDGDGKLRREVKLGGKRLKSELGR